MGFSPIFFFLNFFFRATHFFYRPLPSGISPSGLCDFFVERKNSSFQKIYSCNSSGKSTMSVNFDKLIVAPNFFWIFLEHFLQCQLYWYPGVSPRYQSVFVLFGVNFFLARTLSPKENVIYLSTICFIGQVVRESRYCVMCDWFIHVTRFFDDFLVCLLVYLTC